MMTYIIMYITDIAIGNSYIFTQSNRCMQLALLPETHIKASK